MLSLCYLEGFLTVRRYGCDFDHYYKEDLLVRYLIH